MNHDIERKYFLERSCDYIKALEDHVGEVHVTEDHRVLFRMGGRPFEVFAWISEEYDLITITTRTSELPAAQFEDAVKILQNALQICWDHCVAVSPVENRYDLSMAIFIGGYTFEAFEGVIFNLVSCAEGIEEIIRHGKKKK